MKNFFQITLFVTLFSSILSGCSTLAPERTKADSLVGKNIKEAYTAFGKPWSVSVSTETSVSPQSRLYGQAVYLFQKTGLSYDQDKLAGSYVDTSQGRPILVEQYQTEHIQNACNVLFWADKKTGTIDYYEVLGADCGWGGIGQTNDFHSWGVK